VITLTSLLLIAGSGLVAGFLTGLVSLGGAFIVVPALYHALLSLGVSSHASFTTAVATSVAFVFVSSTSATTTYARRRMIDYRLAIIVSAGALVGVALGIGALTNVDDAVVRHAFGFFIWTLGAYLLAARYFQWGRGYAGNAPTYTIRNQAALAAVGGAVGFLVAAFGIGGGGIVAPAVALLTRSDMKRAVATGVGATVVISVLGSGGYVLSGLASADTVSPSVGWIYLPALALLVPTAMLAAPLGARLALRLSSATLATILATSMFLVGVKLVAS
jgi:uncharacterized membrane protein YfcA